MNTVESESIIDEIKDAYGIHESNFNFEEDESDEW